MLTPRIPTQPIIIPKAIITTEPLPITFIARHIPTPRIKLQITPNVYVKIVGANLTFASRRFKALTFEVSFGAYSFAICSA